MTRRLDVHFWTSGLREPPCGTPEDGFEWSDDIEDVTCEECREALAGESGDLERPARDPAGDHPTA